MDDKKIRTRRRRALSVVVAAGAFGLVTATAASLGGVNVPSLGADTTVIASCDTDGVTLGFTNSYNATTGVYDTTAVNVTSINAACNGRPIAVTLRDSGNAALGSGTATVSAGAATITLGTAAPSAQVVGAAVIIS